MAMDRRDVLTGAGALVMAGLLRSSAEAAEHDHAAVGPTTAVLDNAVGCELTGELCIDHCFEILKSGDTSIAGCAESVHEMLAVNGAVARLGAMGSPRLAAIARAALPVYENCRTECEKHAAKHEVCKKCAQSCIGLIKAVEALPS